MDCFSTFVKNAKERAKEQKILKIEVEEENIKLVYDDIKDRISRKLNEMRNGIITIKVLNGCYYNFYLCDRYKNKIILTQSMIDSIVERFNFQYLDGYCSYKDGVIKFDFNTD